MRYLNIFIFIYILIANAHIKLIQRMNYFGLTLLIKQEFLPFITITSYPCVFVFIELSIFIFWRN
jgi:hypothetical protein